MRRLILWTATTLLTGSLCLSGPHAQDADDEFFPPGPGSGSVGSVDDLPADDDELEDWWPAMVPDSPYEGPLGQVDNREPHEACENCFVIPGIFDYEIFESVPVDDGESEQLIPRRLANPSPLEDDAAPRPTVDADGEPLWYIGTQAYSGPQDTAPLSAQVNRPLIELKRIQARHQARIMGLAGVHGFGIVASGFGIWVLPEYAEVMMPKAIEGVPVTVFTQAIPERKGHQNVRFRPVPIGAGIATAAEGLALRQIAAGTLGPHVVRRSGSRWLVWSLTAAHVVRLDPTAIPPKHGTIEIYQPTVAIGNRFGHVRHVFRQRTCGTSRSACLSNSAPTNASFADPDIAAIDPDPYNVALASPSNRPTGTDATRHLQGSATGYINGPSGVVRTATPGHTLKVWSAFTGPRVAQVRAVNQIVISSFRGRYYKDSGMTLLHNIYVADGDSGAAVTYGGRGRRHIAGVLTVGSPREGWFIPADDIRRAFKADTLTLNHFWGTQSLYRAPATKTCDEPDGC